MRQLVYRQSTTSYVIEKAAIWLMRKLTQNASGIFLRSGDEISFIPATGRTHEPETTNLILKCAREGYPDFLLDIGANVGLISLQCAPFFTVVHGFEPNPELAKILEINC